VRDAVSAGRVFADPVERDGTTLVGVAHVYGGGGGEVMPDGSSAGGVGLASIPVGAYVLRAGKVRWIPAVDGNLLLLVVGLLALVALLTRHRKPPAASPGDDTGTLEVPGLEGVDGEPVP
jgi:hypothetical protein